MPRTIASVKTTQTSSSWSSSGWRRSCVDRPLARLAVAGRVEHEAEALAEPPVALGPELRPRAGEREVDVEEDGAQAHRGARRPYASGRRLASEGRSRRIRRSRAPSSSAVTTVSSSGASQSTIPHGSATSERP